MIVVEKYKNHFVCGYIGPSILSDYTRTRVMESMCEALRGAGDWPEILAMNDEVLDESGIVRAFRNHPMPIGRFEVIIVGDKYCPPTRMYLGSKMMFQELYQETLSVFRLVS